MRALYVAHDQNRLIGSSNELPWRGKLPGELRNFKKLTVGHAVIMGRKTHESIGKPLPHRLNIVLTHQSSLPGVEVVRSLSDAYALAEERGLAAFVIGGRSVYEEALPHTALLYLTQVQGSFEGDVYFPEYNLDNWQQIYSEEHAAAGKLEFPYTFGIYQRKGNA